MERSDELTYLKYFYRHVELGPASSTIRDMIKAWFIMDTHQIPPKNYFDYIQVEDGEKFVEDCSQEEIEQWVRNQD